MSGEYKTFIQFIKSNNSFYNAIESKENALDFNIILEIILLYLKTRFTELAKLKPQNMEVLQDIILNENYHIRRNKLIYKNRVIELKDLLDLVRLVREYPDDSLAKIYYLSNYTKKGNPNETVLRFPKPAKILHFIPPKVLSYAEKSKKYSATYIVDDIAEEYIRETRINFKRTMDEIIDGLLNNDLSNLNITSLKLLVGLLDIYALNYYYHHNKDFINTLHFPVRSIGIGESNYKGKDISDCKIKIEILKQELVLIMQMEKFAFSDPTRTKKLKAEEEKLSKEIMDMLLELSNIKEMPSNYNPHLLENLMKSIESNNVEVETDRINPKMRFFNIERKETIFHSTMSLDTFTNIVDKDDILSVKHLLSKRPK